MKKLTLQQAEIVTGYTGILAMPFDEFHAAAEKKLKGPIWTHQFGSKQVWWDLKKAYRDEFAAIAADKSNGWIECAKELPADGVGVLVVRYDQQMVAELVTHDGEHFWREPEDLRTFSTDTVTHWQHLPDMPA